MKKIIPAETFLELLFNVRKCQYAENKDKYLMSFDKFFEIFVRSDWHFTSIPNLEDRKYSNDASGKILRLRDEYLIYDIMNDLNGKIENWTSILDMVKTKKKSTK